MAQPPPGPRRECQVSQHGDTTAAIAPIRTALLAVLAVAFSASLASSAQAADGDSLFIPREPQSLTEPPSGYSVSASRAVEVSSDDQSVQERLPRGQITVRPFEFGESDWQVSFYSAEKEVLRTTVDGRSGRVEEVLTGPQIEWPLARGAHGPRARRLHVFLVLSGLLFLLSLTDRRVFTARNLDLLVLVSFGASHFFAARGEISLSVPLVYPPLLYLSGRCAWYALRPGRGQPHVPVLSPRIMAPALVGLLLLRYGYDVADSGVNDVGYASVYGADSLAQGLPLYDGSGGSGNLDTYGPFTYLAYVPFELLFPLYNLAHASADAARAASIVFDLLTVVGLVLLGRQLRPGRQGRDLGVLLAWGYASYPWTLFVLAENTNDGLVAMLLVFTLLAARSAPLRGILLGCAVMAKFAPLVLAGLLARVGRERGLRPVTVYAAAFAATVGLLLVAYLPDGGLREFYDATIGFQLSRSSPFSIWGLHPGWEPLHAPLTALVGLAAAAALVVPRRRTVPCLAAAGAALLFASQIGAEHWFYFYLPWALPYALVTFFAGDGDEVAEGPDCMRTYVRPWSSASSSGVST